MHVEFALCYDDRIASELRRAGATVHILGRVRARNPFQIFRARRRLVEILSAGAFDAVIYHMTWPLALFGPASRRVKLPLIFWMHDAISDRNWLVRWARFCLPDLAICNSQFTASTIGRLFSKASFEVLYYPVAHRAEALEAAERQGLRSRLNTPSDAIVLIQASRMESWKGHLLLIEALARLSHVPGWVCWIAGGPQRREEFEYEKSLHERVIKFGLAEHIRFLGQRSDVAQLLLCADIHCQPNLGPEPFGITFIEAMHAGLPVVTTAAGGPLEIVDESCGVLVPPGDPASLASQLEILIKNEGLRRRLGAAGARRAAEMCDPGRQLRRLQAIVERTVHSRIASL
jgi:glycosyltransferase involved in cell wall biosynthesis